MAKVLEAFSVKYERDTRDKIPIFYNNDSLDAMACISVLLKP